MFLKQKYQNILVTLDVLDNGGKNISKRDKERLV